MSSVDLNTLLRIVAERESQDERWGEQNHPDISGGTNQRLWFDTWTNKLASARSVEDAMRKSGSLGWDLILREEVYEALAAKSDEERITELVQVAAVAVAWIESIRRRQQSEKAAKELARMGFGTEYTGADSEGRKV